MNELDKFKKYPDIIKVIKERCRNEEALTRMKTNLANGFVFADTIEGHKFWHEILRNGNIEYFYTKYPKIKTSKLD